uniref:Gamma-tubulin complex component n=1 Tax=Romanomermis culicivorax TaxID=13658 RepID=A0A915IAS9_ROMCU
LFAPYNKLSEKDKFFRTFSSCGISNVDSNNQIDIAGKSLEFQEKLLISDLIFVLQGVEGEYIRISEKDNKKLILSIEPSFDSALRTLVYRILPLAIDFDKVVNFCRNYGLYVKGLIIQAYCSSLKILIEEYLTLISQLEFQPSMSIQKLYLYVQPVQKTMRLLAEFCEQISKNKAHGGGVLSYLHKKCAEFSGDKSATDLCNFLLNYASRPYVKMLERWLYFGEIFDTYSEFMIRENIDPKKKLPSGAAFDEIENWEYRYYVKVEMCPSNLTSVADKILNCGKYLNIVTSCG